MRLYNVAYSGNSYKARLLLSHLGIPCEIIEVDILKGERRTVEFLKINPNGRTPVLDDNGFVLTEAVSTQKNPSGSLRSRPKALYSSKLRGQSALSNRDSERSARSFPPVWNFA
jgi:glutathione S-transferase